MNKLPKYAPQQWIIIAGNDAFAQIKNATLTEAGWRYTVVTEPGGTTDYFVEEAAILGYLEAGKWQKVQLSSLDAGNAYSE